MHEPEADPLWYKKAIIYELSIRAFQDSNADGIGDIPGLIERLPYLQDLGVNCLWLLPFFPSPLRDDGYDIADYYSVNPDYGNVEDFRRLLDEAHRRGIRILVELVVNHTSDQHAWFQEARRDPASPKRSWYVWSDTDELYREARIIFLDTERSNWTWDPVGKQYFWHRFFSHQPDLNYDNPEVQEEILNVMRYWLRMGVDGFRVDAVPYLFEREGTNCENLPETHAFLKRLRATLDEEFGPGRVLLAEANQWPADVRKYFGDGDEFHMGFHFPVMPRLFMAIRREERTPIVEIMQQTPDIPDNCQWANFLRNHDELTLEMVTDEDRDYMYQEYAHDPRMRINLGIRRRLAPLMENGRRRIELMHSLLFSLPGTPVLYYGDELGMGDNIYLGDRNGVRTPMQWTGDRNASFSRADSMRLFAPLITDPVYGYQSVNVEAQERVKSSLLQWVRRLVRVRQRYPGFALGSLDFLHPANRRVLAFTRTYEGMTLLVVSNLSRFAQPAELDLSTFEGVFPVELIGETPFPCITERPYQLSLGPYMFLWFRLDGASAAQGAQV
ncbi:MAG: maltose alpha-D-glucosyltransferase [Myxococcaceae bacterium]|nr:maltose alpha-D-glucosyltransferase [Myxococcaceae bacterium]MCI0669179.1 maltose alpha-D-glucosyltransferase [Myxococcaceae bacterium]